MWLERAERIRTQQRNDKNKLYALHAPRLNASAKARHASRMNSASKAPLWSRTSAA